ncbi:MAG: DNA-deoxyinosine glycosylase [Bacteroidales bacterium]|nr:DNA-deoxyinosine glycosylase [Bacteroidales bacterium]
MNEQIFSFPPILATHPGILILGTMPSVASLLAAEYYGNPKNAFWRILSAIHGIDCPTDYKSKIQLITDMNLALWDICHTCIRPGSADSDIRNEEPNPVKELLAAHPSIHTLLFNGKTAEKLFRSHFKTIAGINMATLPSTSPAYTLPFEQKLAAWTLMIQPDKK